PLHDEYFTASSGNGARMNKKQIFVSGTKAFEDAIFATGFPFRCKDRFPAYQESFSKLFYKIGGMRRLGSAALDLCYVACGRYDGYWEVGLQVWDSAAASLIVAEAGGRVTDFKGADSYLQTGDTLAGNPLMHKHALKIIRQIPALQKKPL
ncbi:MAG: inositol monophosphatase, partial [Candidatus Omnitrophica bacterium]|nr:inositol monophosphatase [Candidatus Omnitrophota bacterium]